MSNLATMSWADGQPDDAITWRKDQDRRKYRSTQKRHPPQQGETCGSGTATAVTIAVALTLRALRTRPEPSERN